MRNRISQQHVSNRLHQIHLRPNQRKLGERDQRNKQHSKENKPIEFRRWRGYSSDTYCLPISMCFSRFTSLSRANVLFQNVIPFFFFFNSLPFILHPGVTGVFFFSLGQRQSLECYEAKFFSHYSMLFSPPKHDASFVYSCGY
jgi:hypothetical protein